MKNEYFLQNLGLLKEEEWRVYSEGLPPHIYNKIYDFEIEFTVFDPGIPKEIAKVLFSRIKGEEFIGDIQ